jgi:hypothetical protein
MPLTECAAHSLTFFDQNLSGGATNCLRNVFESAERESQPFAQNASNGEKRRCQSIVLRSGIGGTSSFLSEPHRSENDLKLPEVTLDLCDGVADDQTKTA